MNNLEEIRQTIFSTFKTLHNVAHSSVPINWPNFALVDTEALTGSFVSVQLTFRHGTEMFDVTALDDIVRGELLISYLRPVGKGLTGSAAYSDMLRAGMCYKKLSGITYKGLTILEVSPAPGLVGQMNAISFVI